MTLEDRIQRLERVILGFAALITGEAQAVAKSPEELEGFQLQMAKDMEEIAKGLK